MKKIFAIVAVIVALLIIVLTVATFIVLLPLPVDRSVHSYRDMGDAVQVDYNETSFYMGNGSYEVNSTYTTVVLDMTRGKAGNASGEIVAGPAGESPVPGTGDLVSNAVGRIIITRAGDSVPVVMPVTWVTDVSFPGNVWILTTEQAVQVNDGQPDGITVSSPNSSLLNESLGGDLVVESQIVVVRPGTDYLTNSTTKGYNNEIRQGQESWFESDVAGEQTMLKVDLRWKNPANQLRLIVYTPDGHVLGPYYDDSDDLADGRINVDIFNPEGVAPGEWHYKVNGMEVQGKDDYYIRTG